MDRHEEQHFLLRMTCIKGTDIVIIELENCLALSDLKTRSLGKSAVLSDAPSIMIATW